MVDFLQLRRDLLDLIANFFKGRRVWKVRAVVCAELAHLKWYLNSFWSPPPLIAEGYRDPARARLLVPQREIEE